MCVIKHMRTGNFNGYWFSWNFAFKVIKHLFWVQPYEKQEKTKTHFTKSSHQWSFVSAHVSLKVATNEFFRGMKTHKKQFWCYYSKAKMEDCGQGSSCFSGNIWLFIPCSATYFLEVSARVSLKVTTNSPFGVKKNWKWAVLTFSAPLGF